MRRQIGPAMLIEQPVMCFPVEAQGAGDGYVGMADVIAEPEPRMLPRAARFERGENV